MPADAARNLPPAPQTAEVDLLLTAQIAVAWAGEGQVGEEPRLGWWRSDLTSEFGGRDLFERLLPRTHRWAVLQAVREAARVAEGETPPSWLEWVEQFLQAPLGQALAARGEAHVFRELPFFVALQKPGQAFTLHLRGQLDLA